MAGPSIHVSVPQRQRVVVRSCSLAIFRAWSKFVDAEAVLRIWMWKIFDVSINEQSVPPAELPKPKDTLRISRWIGLVVMQLTDCQFVVPKLATVILCLANELLGISYCY